MTELEFHGSYGMPLNRYDELFKLIKRGSLQPGEILGNTISLNEAPEVLQSMDDFQTVGIPVINEF